MLLEINSITNVSSLFGSEFWLLLSIVVFIGNGPGEDRVTLVSWNK